MLPVSVKGHVVLVVPPVVSCPWLYFLDAGASIEAYIERGCKIYSSTVLVVISQRGYPLNVYVVRKYPNILVGLYSFNRTLIKRNKFLPVFGDVRR